MNRKILIGSIVGGVLVFMWQFMSWSLVNIHDNEQKYTEKQDTILQFLNSQNLDEGTYMLPRPMPGSSQEEMQKAMEASAGKPWAVVTIHKAMNTDMVMPMVRGLLTDIVAVFLLCWLLGKIPSLNVVSTMTICICIAVVSYLTTEYTHSIWYQYNSLAYLVDAVGCWAICGAWLGWWLKRE